MGAATTSKQSGDRGPVAPDLEEQRADVRIRLHQDDNVVVAAQNIGAGATIPGEGVVTASPVPSGHKIATRAIVAGDYVRKYNQIIGVATADIAPGDHVHVQNCAMSDFERDYAFCADARPTQYFTGQDRATFKGIVREDGRVATRNFIGVLTTVNCSATVAKRVAAAFENGSANLCRAPVLSGDDTVPALHRRFGDELRCAEVVHRPEPMRALSCCAGRRRFRSANLRAAA